MLKPISWNDITVSQFMELYSVNKDDFELMDDYHIQILSIIYDLPISYFEDMGIDEYKSVLANTSFLSKQPINKISQSIITNGITLYFIDNFNALTIGEFIDLENLFINGFIKNLNTILAILYRQKQPNENPLLFNDRWEPYGDWIYLRAPLFDDVKITDVYGIITKFINYRNDLYEKYSGLFDQIEETDDVEIDNTLPLKERAEITKAINREKTLNKWGWDLFLLKLANNDPTKIEEATDMNLVLCLNVLSMIKETLSDL